ncbi:MAG: hypothetical protein ACTSW3_07195 [Promethearchaeota archaeon]
MEKRTKCTIIILMMSLILVNIVLLNQDKTQIIDYKSMNSHYENLAEKYTNDPEVINIFEKCNNSSSKVECVYNEIPFTWTNREGGETFSPSKLIKLNGKGLCRDISVARYIALKNLRIESRFMFKPKHIYIVAFENGKIYELNNGVIIER